jgi:hypothetical protein
LREALRLVNAWGASTPTITFSGPMTISGAGTLTIGHRVNLVAPAGVILDTLPLSIACTGVLVSGLELARQAAAVTVQAGADASFRDVYLHDGAGLLVAGSAHLHRVRMSGCAGTCVRVDGSGARLAVWYSELRGSGGDEGIRLEVCGAPAGSGVYQFSPWLGASVLSGFDTAVRSSCAGAAVYSNTFVGNGTGVYGTGQFLLSNVFSGQTVAAFASAACASAFDGYSPRQQLVWQNASDGCLAGEIASPPTSTTDTFSADPLFVFPAARDYRIQHGSPARDSGFDYVSVGYPQDLNDAGPGYYFGAADRGGRETY